MSKIPFGPIAKKLLSWLVKKGLEEARKEADRATDRAVDAPSPSPSPSAPPPPVGRRP